MHSTTTVAVAEREVTLLHTSCQDQMARGQLLCCDVPCVQPLQLDHTHDHTYAHIQVSCMSRLPPEQVGSAGVGLTDLFDMQDTLQLAADVE